MRLNAAAALLQIPYTSSEKRFDAVGQAEKLSSCYERPCRKTFRLSDIQMKTLNGLPPPPPPNLALNGNEPNQSYS